MLKDIARALSLANLCFIQGWVDALNTDQTVWLVLFQTQSFNKFLSLMINVLLLATLFWTAIFLARRSRKKSLLKIARFIFPLSLIVPGNGIIRMVVPNEVPNKLLIIQFGLLALAILVISISDLKPWDRILPRTASVICIVLFPFFLFTFSQALWSMANFSDKPLAAMRSQTSQQRVLWLVFDELDQQMAFTKRPANVPLPNLDRLRNESIFSLNAYPPADTTLISLPALITGKMIRQARPANPSTLMITLTDSETELDWGRQPHLFSKAQEAGFNTAIVGYYIPYCRMLGDRLNFCCWQDIATVSLRENLVKHADTLIHTVPLGPNLLSRFSRTSTPEFQHRGERQKQLQAYTEVLACAKQAALNSDLGLTLVHWPVPHSPNIYNRHDQTFALNGKRSYLDNLRLADIAFGELRRVMQEANLWEETIVLVTSDHGWRPEIWRGGHLWSSEDEETYPRDGDLRIPFLLKLAGQKQPLTYEPEFNTVLTQDLILALLGEQIRTPKDVIAWLDQHRTSGATPYRLHKSKP